jgi:beta-hydroxylase
MYLTIIIILIIIILYIGSIETVPEWINNLFVTNIPIYETDVAWCKILRDNYTTILDEYNDYIKNNSVLYYSEQIPAVSKNIDVHTKWKTIILRVYNIDTSIIKFFPKTISLVPKHCSLVMFSILEPNCHLKPHKGIYNGVLRYHLALKTPKDYNNCYLEIKDNDNEWQKIIWQQGEDVIFDDMFTHQVFNKTSEERVVLFLDIIKKNNNLILDWLNHLCIWLISTNDAIKIDKTN